MSTEQHKHWVRKLDKKNRIVVPKPLRPLLGKRIWLRAASHGQAYLYDPSDDKRLREELGPQALDVVMEIKLDSYGRILLPKVFVVHLFQGEPDESRTVTLRRTSWFDTGDYILLWTDAASSRYMARVFASSGLGEASHDILANRALTIERDKLLALIEDSLSPVPRCEITELAAEYVHTLEDNDKIQPVQLTKLWPKVQSESQREAFAWQMYLSCLLTDRLPAARRALGKINRLLHERNWHSEILIHISAGRLGRAYTEGKKLARSEPQNYLLQYHLCEIAIRRGRFANALPHLNQIVSHRPEALSHLLRSEYVAQAYGLTAGMARYAAEAVAYRGRSIMGPPGLKDSWIPRNAYKQAVSRARENPRSAQIRSDTGSYLLQLGLFHEAYEHLRECTQLSPKDPEAAIDELCALIGAGEWKMVIEAVEKMPDLGRPTSMAMAIAFNELRSRRKAGKALQSVRDDYVSNHVVTNPVAAVVLVNFLHDIDIRDEDNQ